jgi:hypothetical protein
LFKVGKAENGFWIVFTFGGHTPHVARNIAPFKARYGRLSGRIDQTSRNRASRARLADPLHRVARFPST